MFKLGKSSLNHLSQGKPDLQAVINLAITYTRVDFSVVDVRRTLQEQRDNIANGVSWTMDTRHFPDPSDNLAFAADIYPWHKGKTDHSEHLYNEIAKAMFRAAIELGVDLQWGGFWKTPDKPHWQLSLKSYPKPTHKDTYWNLVS